MARKLTYIQIIRNIVEGCITDMVWKNAERVPTCSDDGIQFDQDEDLIHFTAEITVKYNDYTVHGAVTVHGEAFVSMIEYRRMRCTEKDENGDWITESAKPYHKLVYGEALKNFKFDE